jgi:hypothetical protein
MVSPKCFGVTLPSSGSVPSAFWEMLNWGAVYRILWMGVLCLMTWCVVISDRHATRHHYLLRNNTEGSSSQQNITLTNLHISYNISPRSVSRHCRSNLANSCVCEVGVTQCIGLQHKAFSGPLATMITLHVHENWWNVSQLKWQDTCTNRPTNFIRIRMHACLSLSLIIIYFLFWKVRSLNKWQDEDEYGSMIETKLQAKTKVLR